MLTITKQYKLGRAISYYDLTDELEGKTKEKIDKNTVAKYCDNGDVINAKVQWWQGSPIIRVKTPNVPIVRIDNEGNVLGAAEKTVRNNTQTVVEKAPSAESRVVGKLNNKRTSKSEISYAGYDYKNVNEHEELNRTVDYTGLNTVGDLFDKIASDFRLSNAELYKREFAKKVNVNKALASLAPSTLQIIQSSIATYLMNMAHDEINKVYMKYFIR
jgi:hypothetical protein